VQVASAVRALKCGGRNICRLTPTTDHLAAMIARCRISEGALVAAVMGRASEILWLHALPPAG